MKNDITQWFIQTLTGDANTIIDWRCIHDKRKDLPAHNYRGTFDQVADTLEKYNAKGYGIFCVINALDGHGCELTNVTHIRAHMIDLDDPLNAEANYKRAVEAGANFAVQTSPGKYHVYWKVEPYDGNDFFTMIQRKLAQLYSSDKSIIDPTRVMRVPGFLHQKGEPQEVIGWPLANVDKVWSTAEMEQSLQHINIVEFLASRSPLGTKEMSAPSLDWLKFALTLIDPNDIDRSEWLSFSAAYKQAGWLHADEKTLYDIWVAWCEKYKDNDPGENTKLWNSVKDTEVGWTSIERKTPVKAYMSFGFEDAPPAPKEQPPIGNQIVNNNTPIGVQTEYGEILSEQECREYFKDCYFIERTGQIFSKSGRFMNATQFNGRYGGKQFIISSTGKLTDEPWKAALRSTCWTIPKVDHVRFLPDEPTFKIVEDGLKRRGLNTYIPANIQSKEGDITRWFSWFDSIFPDKADQKIIFDYMAHCVKYPGFKIPWAPLIQSAEGIGKTIFKEVMANALGDMYVYSPKAPELVKSGSTFNAWMRGKLMILVDEIKIDERRELIEILKPMVTDKKVEIQSKGVDQEMEDNPANWIFFSNFKDAIPINQNGRRYAIFYSALQSKADILNAGLNSDFFNDMWKWLHHEGGIEAITHWLINYPIEQGAIAVRAPETSSHEEAINISRSPMEVIIHNCIADELPGFKGGYISVAAVLAKVKGAMRAPSIRVVQNCLENMGYVQLGRGIRPYIQEDPSNRSEIYGTMSTLSVENYGRIQGYE